jgi:hypothetical protein
MVVIIDIKIGSLITNTSSSTEIPCLDEFYNLGFSNSFDKVESSVKGY